MKKPNLLKSCSKLHLPDDLWPEILCRLPVKNLLRFRCVSNSWQTLIDDPDFAQSQLALFNNNRLDSHLLFCEGSNGRSTEFVFRRTENFKPNLQLNKSGLPSVENWFIFSSVDGLFILKSRQSPPDIMLWNPSIRKTLILPPTPAISKEMVVRDFGMGFDPLVKDYKYIRLVQIRGSCIGSVAVYSLGTDSWRTIDFRGEHCLNKSFSIFFDDGAFCLRGVLYALAWCGDQLISFDLSREMLASTKLPAYLQLNHPKLTIVDGGRSLAVINNYERGGSRSIWVSEGLGDDIKSWSWSERYIFTTTIIPQKYPLSWGEFLYIGKNGEVLLNWMKDMVISYHLETREEKIILRGEVYGNRVWPYMESLVLLN